MRRLDINKLNAHSNPGLHDSYDPQRFYLLILFGQRDANPRIRWKRLAGTDKCSPQREVRGDSLGLRSCLQVDHFRIRSQWVANAEAPVANGNPPRFRLQFSIIHINDVAQSRFCRGEDVQ